ncbi:MAG: hypothetical protein IJK01_03485 [Clostridia bacterium]|nr:hypothetical protein [Clostridia bacterium]
MMKRSILRWKMCRNERMIDRSDVVIAYVSHSFGGAYQTLCYAQRKQKRIVRYPDCFTSS